MTIPQKRRPVRPNSSGVGSFRVLAHAKVNLTLEVLRRRDDGYHEIRSIMAPLALADRLTLTPGGRGLRIEVTDDPALETDDNLALRAALAFREAFGGFSGLKIVLEKRIPVAAGLGGGSSDAAAVLRALGRWRGIDRAKLHPLAEALGSDVPFFLTESAAVASGRGEHLDPGPRLPPLFLLLVKPEFGISAGDAYRAWGQRTKRTFPPSSAPTTRAREESWERAPSPTRVGGLLRNDLQPGCVELQPHLAGLLERLSKLRPAGVLMSGSGSACFAVFGSRPALQAAARRFAHAPGERVILTRSLGFRVAGKPQLK